MYNFLQYIQSPQQPHIHVHVLTDHRYQSICVQLCVLSLHEKHSNSEKQRAPVSQGACPVRPSLGDEATTVPEHRDKDVDKDTEGEVPSLESDR